MKRMTPDTAGPSVMDPELRMAEVTLPQWRTALSTWPIAIGAEILALMLIPAGVARFMRHVAKWGRLRMAWLGPVVALALLVVYALAVGWSFDADYDVFIGDALLGAALYNAISLPWTLIYGGFTLPAVWVAVVAATNLLLIMRWDQEQARTG